MTQAPFRLDDPAVIEEDLKRALDEGDYAEAHAQIERLMTALPEAAQVLSEVLPALQALSRSRPHDAVVRLVHEASFSTLRTVLLRKAADEVDRGAGGSALAGAARAVAVQQDPDDTGRVALRRISLDHYRRRVGEDAADGVAWERLALILAGSGERAEALHAAEEALAVDPSRHEAARLVVGRMVEAERSGDAAQHLVGLIEAAPEVVPLYLLLSFVQEEALHDRGGAIETLRAALEVEPGHPDVVPRLRQLLELEEQWPELAELLREMIEATPRIDEKAALWDELATVLSNRVNDPREAAEARRRAAALSDIEAVVAGWWNDLEARAAEPAAWEEADLHFRANERWEDLAELCVRRLRLIDGAVDLALLDDLALATAQMKKPDWNRVERLVTEQLQQADDPALRASLQTRLESIQEARTAPPPVERQPTSSESEGEGGNSGLVMLVIFGLAVLVGGILMLFLLI